MKKTLVFLVLLALLLPSGWINTRAGAAWQGGSGDYLNLREQLFQGETVATLFEKVRTYQGEGR